MEKWAHDKLKELNVFELDLINYSKEFLIGVTGENDTALYKEFSSMDIPATIFISFIRNNTSIMNAKSGLGLNKYKNIFITTIQDQRYLYQNTNQRRENWLNQINEIHLD